MEKVISDENVDDLDSVIDTSLDHDFESVIDSEWLLDFEGNSLGVGPLRHGLGSCH